jgi:hypothetical protein
MRAIKVWLPLTVGCALIGGTLAIVSPDSSKEVVLQSLGSQYLENELGRKLTQKEQKKLEKKLKALKIATH